MKKQTSKEFILMQRESMTYIKTMNMRNVLNCIVEEKARTRADISKKLNLSKPTVSSIVKQLLKDGWIYETGSGDASADGGRKPVQLKFNAKRSYIIGIDIGGTNVTIGITDLNGDVCAFREFPTRQHLHNNLFGEIKRCVNSMKSQLRISDVDILGLGAGVPGVTNVIEGRVIEGPALNWKQLPIREEFRAIFDFPIEDDKDENRVVLGEHRRVAASEIGYVVRDRYNVGKIQPVFEGYGYLESVASGSSISYELSSRLGRDVTAKEAFELYEQGDADAVSVINFAIDHLAIGIANYVSLFDPEIIILGGGVSNSFPMIRESLVDIIKQYTPRECEVIQTTFGEEAGIIGAAALFLKEYDLLLTI